jgi:hypothetical protein
MDGTGNNIRLTGGTERQERDREQHTTNKEGHEGRNVKVNKKGLKR